MRTDPAAAEAQSREYVSAKLMRAAKTIRPITEHLARSFGKGVRTKLLLAAATGEDGLVPHEAVQAAAAIELFHMATLVHDDIIDEAEIRRGIASVQARFGKKEAVICGDYLLCVAVRIISSIGAPHISMVEKFAVVMERICLGELRQLGNNFNMDITFFEYMKIIRGKTAALFYISAYAGGVLAGEDDAELQKLARLGSHLGMAFQILDDCKDYTLNESEALKPTQKDIATGVVNLPLLLAFIKEPALRDFAKNAGIFDKVRSLGAVKDAQNIAEKYHLKIQKIIDGMENRRKAAALQQLIDGSV